MRPAPIHTLLHGDVVAGYHDRVQCPTSRNVESNYGVEVSALRFRAFSANAAEDSLGGHFRTPPTPPRSTNRVATVLHR